MDDEQARTQAVINFEGQTLAFAGQHGLAIGRTHAQCVIDGAANALARMDGPKNAATYLYAVADRIVGGVREPTPLPAVLLPAPKALQLIHAIEEVEEVNEPLPRLLQPPRVSPTIIAVSFALLVALLVTPWR